ncbi:MAG: S8 family serine peptidase [Pirellulaceae bacterium]
MPRAMPRLPHVVISLFALFILVLAPGPLPQAAEEDSPSETSNTDPQPAKLDEGLDGDDTRYAVFLRMEDQLFRHGGDYEAFCQKHETTPRTLLRRQVTRQLREKSNASWEKVREKVASLQADGRLEDLQRYWIVNGFACQATGAACRDLAALDEVSFVYRQRLPQIPLQARPVPLQAAPSEARVKAFRNVAEQWSDDSDQPFSTEGFEIPWNVKRIKADQAWSEEGVTGKGVVVALCDTGLMLTPSLTAALWKNPNEQLNGKDDDGNGYVDDLFGYDFGAQNAYCLEDGPQVTHGSMCGGIVAGRPLNKEKLLTGIAPRSRLMMLRGMGHLKAYEYALAEGADVMSMSYMFPGVPLGNYRGVYRLAHEHLAAGGVVSVGGAGNFAAGPRAQPKGKQIALPKDIPCVIAAAGIVEDGSKPAASSEGPCYWEGVKFYDDYPRTAPLQKPDVTGCFGGYPVWGRPAIARRVGAWKLVSDEGDGSGLVVGPQGNSFSGPHAAGAAALMLSADPDLNPWQVKRLLQSTCTDLGAEGHDTVYGAGLIDAAAAVRAVKARVAK